MDSVRSAPVIASFAHLDVVLVGGTTDTEAARPLPSTEVKEISVDVISLCLVRKSYQHRRNARGRAWLNSWMRKGENKEEKKVFEPSDLVRNTLTSLNNS